MIPYSRQYITKDDISAVEGVLKSDWLTQGPMVEKFERALAKYTCARFAVVFSSGTAALQAAYFAIDFKKGDEIITSPLTFAATSNAALWQGAKVIFADVDPETGNLDPKEVEKKITRRTKAIVPVDYAGLPVRLSEFKKIAKKHNLILIEDAAHALGASYKGKKIGSISDMTMFSFHPVKSITTGEGGAIVTNRKGFYEKMLLFRSHGITKDPKKFLNKKRGDWYSEMQELGLNYRMTEMQAALGISQLKKLPAFLKSRKIIAAHYQKEFDKRDEFIIPRESKNMQSAWHLYPLRLARQRAKRRDKIFMNLRNAGIGAQVHYIPVYLHPYYRKLGYKNSLCPKAEEFFKSEISIPIFPALGIKTQTYIVKTILACLKK